MGQCVEALPLFFFTMKRDFKGIWIPAAVWLDESLTITEKCMLAEIESLDNDERGCYASNEYLGKFLGISTGSAANMISKLKGMGLIVQLFFDGRNRGLRVPILHIDVNNLHTGMKADFMYKGKQRSHTREHITKGKNKEDNKVDNSSFSNEKGFREIERENIGDVAAEFEQFGEPAPLKAEKKKSPPKLRGAPPAAKEPTETYLMYEAWARFVESKGIAVAKNATGTSYQFAPKDGAAIKKWREWCAGLPNATGSLEDWQVFLQAAWEHGGKWYQSNFTPCILNSKRQELMAAFARYKAKNEPDMSMVGMSIEEILQKY